MCVRIEVETRGSWRARWHRPPRLGGQLALLAACAATTLVVGCGEVPAAADPSTGGNVMKLKLTSGAFQSGQSIPLKYSVEGEDVSPALEWDEPPTGTKELALVCDDPDAPTSQPWVHWVIYSIPADVKSLPAGIANKPQLTAPVTARQGMNSWQDGTTIGYRGPAPPPGKGPHRYYFKLYALDTQLELPPKATKDQLVAAMKGHILAEGTLMGKFEREK